MNAMVPSPGVVPTAKSRRRILIVEDHPLMRSGVVAWIHQACDLEVCGEADTAPTGLRLAQELEPDLVLCDITLAGRSGLEMVRDIRAIDPELPVLILSMHEELVYAVRAMRAGARGYVMKRAGGAELVAAIRQVLAGGMAFSRSVTEQVLGKFVGGQRRLSDTVIELTDREFEIVRAFGEGRTSKEIAVDLRISQKTVGTHRQNICRKLGLKSTAELIRYAVQHADG